MSKLAGLTTSEDIKKETESVGGGGTWDTDVYDCKIDAVYLVKSRGGALALKIHAKRADGQVMKTALWMTSGTVKGCKNYYTDKNGDKQYLPGFSQANAICLLTVGKEISELDTEPKVIKLWDFDASKELPKTVDMVVALVDQDIKLGVMKQTTDKNEQNPNFDDTKPANKESNPQYVATGETREENEIDKVFRSSDSLTKIEVEAGETEPALHDKWLDKWKGEVKNKAKGASAGASKAGVPAGGATAPKKSIFAPK